jgi:equilibrative nucleoside transporter 1/2/3
MSGDSPSSDVLYHSVPRSDCVPMVSDVELDGGDETVTPLSNSVDERIRWINFMFGCALLLPWNGAPFSCKFLHLGN